MDKLNLAGKIVLTASQFVWCLAVNETPASLCTLLHALTCTLSLLEELQGRVVTFCIVHIHASSLVLRN